MLLALGFDSMAKYLFYGKTLHSLKWQPETDECVSATDSVKMRVRILTSCKNRVKTSYKQEEGAIILNPKRSLGRSIVYLYTACRLLSFIRRLLLVFNS